METTKRNYKVFPDAGFPKRLMCLETTKRNYKESVYWRVDRFGNETTKRNYKTAFTSEIDLYTPPEDVIVLKQLKETTRNVLPKSTPRALTETTKRNYKIHVPGG